MVYDAIRRGQEFEPLVVGVGQDEFAVREGHGPRVVLARSDI